MSEKRFVKMVLEIEETVVDNLKTALRTSGCALLSATQAVMKAIEVTSQNARMVRLDEPERKELESRTGAAVPIKNSKDILRAFERLIGGENAVVIDMDPGVASVFRDTALGLGFGMSEFANQVLTEAYLNQFVDNVEFKGLYFKPKEWQALLLATGRDRLRSGKELLDAVIEMKTPAEEDPFPSSKNTAVSAT